MDSNPPPSFCQKYWQISALTTNATSHLRPSRVCILPVFLENQIGDILVAMVVRFGLIYGLLGRAPKIILGTRELEWCREGEPRPILSENATFFQILTLQQFLRLAFRVAARLVQSGLVWCGPVAHTLRTPIKNLRPPVVRTGQDTPAGSLLNSLEIMCLNSPEIIFPVCSSSDPWMCEPVLSRCNHLQVLSLLG